MDTKQPCHVNGRAARVQHGEHLGLLLRREFGLPPAPPTLGACRAEACLGSFANHGALELGKRAQHCIIMRPDAVVLSMFSVSEREPAPAFRLYRG